jgi:hypothetical protein
MQNRPVVCFDTSVHNRLMKGGLESEAIYAAVSSRYHVRLGGLCIEELMATPESTLRLALVGSAGRLLSGPGDCLYPPHEVTRRLIASYDAAPGEFDWLRVDVTAPGYADQARTPELSLSDDVARELKQHLDEVKRDFRDMWRNLRPELEPIFVRDGEPRPRRLDDVIPHTLTENGLYWSVAKDFYDRIAGAPTLEAKIGDFSDRCPPFRCAVFAMMVAWYGSLRDVHDSEKFGAGRNDLLMAAYLPYADEFISAEEKREQEKCLAKVARLAGVSTIVRSYDDFCAGLMVLA